MLRLSLKPQAMLKLRKGYPWVYAQDIVGYQKLSTLRGELVALLDEKGKPFAIGYCNTKSKLACRILTFNPKENIDLLFFKARFEKALQFREQRFSKSYYRFIHGESDHLPGLIIDRFGDTLVCQTNTAGMENLKPIWLQALTEVLNPQKIICREDMPLRQKEGLSLIEAKEEESELLLAVEENEHTYFVDPVHGQKTGWFYDQRANRAWIAQKAKGKTVLDLYTYCGAFGLLAAKHGAKEVTLVDSSQRALNLAQKSGDAHGFSQCQYIKADIFDLLPQLQAQNLTYDIVIADPPAFAKQLVHKGQGLRGYQKLAKGVSSLVAQGGLLMIASCSHHASTNEFREAVTLGITKAGRSWRLLRKAGADSDHPIHPLLPETHYLKNLVFAID